MELLHNSKTMRQVRASEKHIHSGTIIRIPMVFLAALALRILCAVVLFFWS